MDFWDKTYNSENEKSEHHHWILPIWISLGTKLQLKGYLLYKAITSQNVLSEAQLRFFYSEEKLCSILKIFKFFNLPNLWRHGEY